MNVLQDHKSFLKISEISISSLTTILDTDSGPVSGHVTVLGSHKWLQYLPDINKDTIHK